MADLEVFLSNPGHHVGTFEPVVGYLAERGVSSRVHSLCELRGFETPAEAFAATGAEVRRVWPAWLSRRGNAEAAAGPAQGRRRALLRRLAWSALLRPRIERCVDPSSKLAMLPNDSAFPYDRVVALLHRQGVPFVLLQEGIRFALPAERESRYGLGGARALAVWGDASAEHFLSLGVDPHRIYVTGCPRFDARSPARRTKAGERSGPLSVLLVTNPIDAQGFCTGAEKTALVSRFVTSLGRSLRERRFDLVLRPHPGESRGEYLAGMEPACRELVQFDDSEDLEAALGSCDIAVVMASTVGLEALRHGVPLAVLPTPGHGYVHDYVQRGAALGLILDESLEGALHRLVRPSAAYSAAIAEYVRTHLAFPHEATQRVGELMMGLLHA